MSPLSFEPVPPQLDKQRQCVVENWPDTMVSPDLTALAVLTFSDFICEGLQRHPEWWQTLITRPPQPDEYRGYACELADLLAGIEDESRLMNALRLFRREKLIRIGWMQTLSQCPTQHTLMQLSVLAESLIIAARDWLYAACCKEMGTPCNAAGESQPLLILAMGKLGGGELNFSSDIDLIFTWPENGFTCGGRRQLDNAQFFNRLGQRLIRVLNKPDSEGFVYWVDMRLRPFGDSGPLVMSFSALEDYYQEQGRDWERYAMVKARLLGDPQHCWSRALHSLLRPFVYRRYIDFSVIQSLRNMKGMIEREVRRRALVDNIKLGAGGIREIEFIVQFFQLIHGGRNQQLQHCELLSALHVISEMELISEDQITVLYQAYLFLRRLENLLQSINDEQTQTLPTDQLNRSRLAWAMGQPDWAALHQHIEQHMKEVRTIFDALIGDKTSDSPEQSDINDYIGLWQGESEAMLTNIPPALIQTITDFREDVNRRTIGPRGRQALEQLIPRLLATVNTHDDATTVIKRLVPLLLSILNRSTYLELLAESPGALQHLIRLCGASPMVASQLARYPMLLDELLSPSTLYHAMASDGYRNELRQYLLRVPEDDEEQQMEALRQFKQIHHLRIAAADINGTLPLMKVSDHLTWLAEAIIEAVVQQAWNMMVRRHGQPDHLIHNHDRGFAVVGYGKLGGWELSYRSDLDLVFLHNCPAGVMTRGARQIDGRQFYLRLAQRIVHLFSTRTSTGTLYEVDARLRPSGSAGMLVSALDAYDEYQQKDAWTWEHQALVRARVVFGDAALAQRFAIIRRRILCQEREPLTLQTAVREMREKMYVHLSNKHKSRWDIKVDKGGITDIEFIAQYLVLRFAHRYPVLSHWSDNVRIFEQMARCNTISQQEAQTLTQAYVMMRDALHQRALQELSDQSEPTDYLAERCQVDASWQRWLIDAPEG